MACRHTGDARADVAASAWPLAAGEEKIDGPRNPQGELK